MHGLTDTNPSNATYAYVLFNVRSPLPLTMHFLFLLRLSYAGPPHKARTISLRSPAKLAPRPVQILAHEEGQPL